MHQVHNTVPSWSVPVISTCGPAAVLVAYYLTAGAARLELHNTLLGCLSCVAATALATNLVKLSVRPRAGAARPRRHSSGEGLGIRAYGRAIHLVKLSVRPRGHAQALGWGYSKGQGEFFS